MEVLVDVGGRTATWRLKVLLITALRINTKTLIRFALLHYWIIIPPLDPYDPCLSFQTRAFYLSASNPLSLSFHANSSSH